MSLDSYSALKVEIASWLDRDDLTGYVDTFIDIAESRHKREIRIRDMLSRSALAITDGDRYIDLPSDFLDIKYLRILIPDVNSGRRYFPDLDQLSIHELTNISINEACRPVAYSIHEQIELNSEADQDYDGELFYYVELTPLSDANTSNSLLVKAPDAYLYGALWASAPFLMNDERVQLWESLYTEVRDTLNRSEIENKMAGPLVSRVPGVRVPRYY